MWRFRFFVENCPFFAKIGIKLAFLAQNAQNWWVSAFFCGKPSFGSWKMTALLFGEILKMALFGQKLNYFISKFWKFQIYDYVVYFWALFIKKKIPEIFWSKLPILKNHSPLYLYNPVIYKLHDDIHSQVLIYISFRRSGFPCFTISAVNTPGRGASASTANWSSIPSLNQFWTSPLRRWKLFDQSCWIQNFWEVLSTTLDLGNIFIMWCETISTVPRV